MSSVALVEVFRSVQGEGYHSGRPAIFVRVAGCNLSCVFAEGALCDTPYQKSNFKALVPDLFTDYVLPLLGGLKVGPRLAHRGWNENRPMLVLTGGEPTLAPAFDDIIDAAREHNFYVAVETNGTRWRAAFERCDWITVSPKEDVAQGSPFKGHNPNPQSAALEAKVVRWLGANEHLPVSEYRYVIAPDSPTPPYYAAFRHYVSPATLSDGTGLEWQKGFPGFVPGALDRCHEIVWQDPRWRISLQTHKLMGVR